MRRKNDYTSIKQSEDFRLASRINTVANVTCHANCTLEHIQLLVLLCSRMQYLKTAVLLKDLESTIRFLLDKNNENTRHLHLLQFSDYNNYIDQINTLIKSEKLFDDYTLIKNGSYCFLW